MRLSLRLWPVLILLSVTQAFADARTSVLVDVLRLPEVTQLLSNEGLGYADILNAEMLNGQGGAGWYLQVAAIYDPVRMVEIVRTELESELTSTQVEEAIAFYGSALGNKIVRFENSARATIQDADVEEAARARYLGLEGTDDPRLALVDRYIASGDMVNRNLSSALNSNVQFLRGLVEGGAIEMSEDEILADVSSDIEATRADTTSWLFGFLLLAYSPLNDAELEAYITFSNTKAGQTLNRALFTGFGMAYDGISYALGSTIALNMTAQEL